MSLWAGPPIHRTCSVHPRGQVRRAGDEFTFPLGGSVSRNLRTETAAIPVRGDSRSLWKLPLSVRLSYLLPKFLFPQLQLRSYYMFFNYMYMFPE